MSTEELCKGCTKKDTYNNSIHHITQHITNFIRYLDHRELVMTGLHQFNNQLENFQNAIRGLDLTHNEEMDFLVKQLSKESVEHAKRNRAVHLNHLERVLRMIWDRIKECYSSPEIIEIALFKRADNNVKQRTIIIKGIQWTPYGAPVCQIRWKPFWICLPWYSPRSQYSSAKASLQSPREVVVLGFQLQVTESCSFSYLFSIHRFCKSRS